MRTRAVRLTAAVLLVLLVSIGLEGISKALATPLLFGLWILQLVVVSIPQGVFWAIPVIAGAIVLARVLHRQGRRLAVKRTTHRLRPEGIRVWSDLLVKARERGYFRWRLAKDLCPLFLDALAARQAPQVHPLDGQPPQVPMGLPEELRAYLSAGTSTRSYRQYLEERIARGASSPLDLEPERVVQYLEDAVNLAKPST